MPLHHIATGYGRSGNQDIVIDRYAKGSRDNLWLDSELTTYEDGSVEYRKILSPYKPMHFESKAAFEAAGGLNCHEVSKDKRKKKAAAVFAGIALLAAVTSRPAHDRPREEVDTIARNNFGSMNYSQQFLASYVAPESQPVSTKEGGFGVLGLVQQLTASHELRIGSTCLANTAYDPTPSKITGRADGEIKSTTTMSMNDRHNFIVTPAGGGSAVLEFTVDDGRINPTEQTAESLRANGCDSSPSYSFDGKISHF